MVLSVRFLLAIPFLISLDLSAQLSYEVEGSRLFAEDRTSQIVQAPKLIARANFTDSFNLPIGAFFANTTIRLNNAGEAAFPLNVLPGTTARGVWQGDASGGGVVYESPLDAFLSGVGINNNGTVVFTLTDAVPSGIYGWDPVSGMGSFLTSQPLGAFLWGSAQITDTDVLGYRAGFPNGNAYVLFDATTEVLAVEAGLDPGSPYSFLFTPSLNQSGEIGAKVRLGTQGQIGDERPDEIRIFMPGGMSKLVVADADSGVSDFVRFDNAVDLTDGGKVAFTAELTSGARAVCLWDDPDVTIIASEDDPMISEIEFFAPAANDAGLVVFRAFDASGFRAVWVGDGTDLTIVAREHDIVVTDLGEARIDQHDSGPVFSGGVDIDASGRVSFAAGLTPPDNDQIEWGTGAFTVPFTGGMQPLTATLNDGLIMNGTTALPGDVIGYSIQIENPAGNDAATGLGFSLEPDPRADLIAGTIESDQGTVVLGNGPEDTHVEVQLGDLAGGVKTSIFFTIRIKRPFPPGASSISGQGLVSGDGVMLQTDDPLTPPLGDATETTVSVGPDNDLSYLRAAWWTDDPFVADVNGNDRLDIVEMMGVLFP